MLEFSGAATRLTDADYDLAAAIIACDVAAVRAVEIVETGGVGGFLPDGRPRILFEGYEFSEATGHRWDGTHPNVSLPAWSRTQYRGGTAEYDRLAEAIALDRNAALKSASWGMFQMLGSNFAICGFADVESFVAAMVISERAHIAAFARFVAAPPGVMGAALRALRWADFARPYNGPGWQANDYGGRLASAYAGIVAGPGAFLSPLRIGATGPQVVALQQDLAAAGVAIAIDGGFGRVTELAVERYQAAHGLDVDGVVGPETAAALHLGDDGPSAAQLAAHEVA